MFQQAAYSSSLSGEPGMAHSQQDITAKKDRPIPQLEFWKDARAMQQAYDHLWQEHRHGSAVTFKKSEPGRTHQWHWTPSQHCYDSTA